jgi:hypothetical protein
MRHTPLGVEIWGAFLILVGVGLLVFNKRWAAFATTWTPIRFTGIPSRLLTLALGVVFVVVGSSAFLPIGPGPR